MVVAAVVVAVAAGWEELEELVAEGIALACECDKGLAEGQSLEQALSYWLESRLRDHRRKNHREWRRNSRANSSYTLEAPTGLAWEHAETSAGMPLTDESALLESRLRLDLFKRERDLRDPRLIGKYRGVPSAAGLATGAAAEIWATIHAERARTERKSFGYIKPEEI